MIVWALLGWLALMSMASVAAFRLRQAIMPRQMTDLRAVIKRGHSAPTQPMKEKSRSGDSKRSDAKKTSAAVPTSDQSGDADAKGIDDSTKLAVETIIRTSCSTRRFNIGSIGWPKGRVEVTVTKATAVEEPQMDVSASSDISSDDLHGIHRDVYRKMEEDPTLARLLQTIEVRAMTRPRRRHEITSFARTDSNRYARR